MPIFGRREHHGRSEPAPPASDADWSLVEAAYDGRPMLLRINSALAPLAGDRRYPLRAALAVRCNKPDARGFPSPADSGALSRFEDEFVALFCPDPATLFAAVITTNAMREFVFYTVDEPSFRARFRGWAETPKSHRVQMLIERDPSWSVYRKLTGRPT